jgi:hypothetical protein
MGRANKGWLTRPITFKGLLGLWLDHGALFLITADDKQPSNSFSEVER